MTDLELTAFYRFGSMGSIDALPGALGWSTTFDVSGRRVTVAFPDEGERLDPPFVDRKEEGSHRIMWREADDEALVVAIHYFSVSVDFSVDSSPEALAGGSTAPHAQQLHATIDEINHLAIDVAGRIRRWLFVRQPNLGPTEELPPHLYTDRVRLKATGEAIRWSPSVTLYGSATSEDAALSPEDLGKLGVALATNEEPPAPEGLLAQATAALIRSRGRIVQPELAVLLAAVAAEVKAKRSWESAISEQGRPLLALAFKNPRAFPQAAIDLFDGFAKAVVGRSLREDDRECYKELKALFELRNKVAHLAAAVDEADARTAVSAARTAFAWLDSVLSPG